MAIGGKKVKLFNRHANRGVKKNLGEIMFPLGK